MRLCRLVFVFIAAVTPSVLAAAPTPATRDACKVLTAETFGKIMGYAATTDKTGSTAMSCFYNGPPHSGGQFSILSESATGPQADAMLNRRGSSPPPGSGLIGGTYREGSVLFSVSIRSTDKAKLEALVAEIRHNLK